MNNSTLLIQSTHKDNTHMGTGFIIHRDSYGSYILTCSHVLKHVVIPKIANIDLDVEVKVRDKTLDLALLYVKGLFRTPLELQTRRCKTKDVVLFGFSGFVGTEYQGKPRDATILGDKITMIGKEDNFIYYKWQVIANDKHEIEAGNSGGPLLCKESGRVIAVMSNNKGVQQGFAISIEHLKELWIDMPPSLLAGEASPFVGLSAFSMKQSHLFFGRDKETSEIIEKLKIENIVAVVGDSGSGKSSVIKAGVLPKCLDGDLDSESELKRVFHFIDTRPAHNPFDELANSIGDVSKRLNLKLEDVFSLKEKLKSRDSQKILTILQSIFKERVTLLIYIDQFEELFTLCTDKEMRQSFLNMIDYLVQHQTSNLTIKVVLTMRRDYYNLVSDHTVFYNLIDKQKYTLHRMKDEALKECIVQPLKNTSVSLEEANAFADFVVQDMGDKSSELALLQIALTQTWNHKKEGISLLESYRKVRGVSGALEKLAADTIKILDDEQKEILKYLFIRLVKIRDKGAITRRVVDRDEFSDKEWALVQTLSSALDSSGKLATQHTAKLGQLLNIRGDDETKNETVELVHEALITQWSSYQDWLNGISSILKRTHDVVIDKSKMYRDKSDNKYLLMGADLEEGLSLLNTEYVKYLSENEIAYIENSQSQKERWKWITVGVVTLLLAVIAFLYFRDRPMSIEDLKERIETSEQGRYTKDNDYMDLILVDTKALENIEKEEITKKLIELTPNIANGSEKKYWLNRVGVMKDSKLDALLTILEFEAYINKGNANFNQARHLKAIEAYSEAVEINPKKEYLYQYIGNAYFYMKKYEASIASYKKILEINLNSEGAYFSIGNTYNIMNKPKKAIEYFNKLLIINPNNEYAYNGIGIAYGNMKKHVEALNAFKKVVEINPRNFLAYNSLGLAYSFLGQHREGLTYYKKSLDINPKYEPTYLTIIGQYRYLKEPEKVIEYAKKLIEQNSINSTYYTSLFEFQLMNNMEFDLKVEVQYINKFKLYSYIYARYAMLKILSDIYREKEVNINEWSSKYRGISLNWNFIEEETWINSMSNGDIKNKLLEALKIFKNHR